MTRPFSIRRRSGGLSGGTDSSSTGTATPKRGSRRDGVSVCMTCGHKYDVRFIDGKPVFYDHGTETKHRCKSGGA